MLSISIVHQNRHCSDQIAGDPPETMHTIRDRVDIIVPHNAKPPVAVINGELDVVKREERARQRPNTLVNGFFRAEYHAQVVRALGVTAGQGQFPLGADLRCDVVHGLQAFQVEAKSRIESFVRDDRGCHPACVRDASNDSHGPHRLPGFADGNGDPVLPQNAECFRCAVAAGGEIAQPFP